jgi:hypothetical protein
MHNLHSMLKAILRYFGYDVIPLSPHDKQATALIPRGVNKSASTSSYKPSTFKCDRLGVCPIVIRLEERLSALDKEVRRLKDYKPSTEIKERPITDIIDCEGL